MTKKVGLRPYSAGEKAESTYRLFMVGYLSPGEVSLLGYATTLEVAEKIAKNAKIEFPWIERVDIEPLTDDDRIRLAGWVNYIAEAYHSYSLH